MSCLREVQTISKSPHILPMPSLTRLTSGGVLNPLKNTTNTSHNELLHQDPLQPPLEPRVRHIAYKTWAQGRLARKNSPNTAPSAAFPRKVRPASVKTPILSHCERAGRTFSRTGRGDVAMVQPLQPLRSLMQASMKPPSPLRAPGSSLVEWCNRFVSFGVGYALSWSGGSSCPVGWGVSRDLVRMSRLR